MELYKIDQVDELYCKLNEIALNIYKQAGVLAATAHFLDELTQSKDMDFDQLQTCRNLLHEEALVIDNLEHELDVAESIIQSDYKDEKTMYRWKD